MVSFVSLHQSIWFGFVKSAIPKVYDILQLKHYLCVFHLSTSKEHGSALCDCFNSAGVGNAH